MAQRTVDIHNHYYPMDYIKHLLSRTGKTKAVQTGPQSYVMKASDVIVAHIDRPGHYDLAARIADLDKAGMDTQIVSKTIPGPDMLERDEGVYWAKRINDAAEAACKEIGRQYRDATPDERTCAKAASDKAMTSLNKMVAAAEQNRR